MKISVRYPYCVYKGNNLVGYYYARQKLRGRFLRICRVGKEILVPLKAVPKLSDFDQYLALDISRKSARQIAIILDAGKL